MRHLGGFVFVLTLAALPLSVSAQDEGATAQTGVPGPGRPDASGERYQPPTSTSQTSHRTSRRSHRTDGYALEEMEFRVKRARIGLVSSGISMFAGTVLLLAAAGVGSCVGDPSACDPPALDPLLITGSVLAAGGFVAMIATGVVLGKRKRKLHELELRELYGAHYGRPRRAQWDLARSRLVF